MTSAFVRTGALALGLALAGCEGGGAPHPRSAASVPARGGGKDVADAIDHLNRGEPAAARALLQGVLARDPANGVAAKLVREIDGDPVALLGAENHPYVTRPGDTMTTLAARFLGSPLSAYALARYNGIAVPASLAAGRTLRIPGKDRSRRPEPPAEHAAPAERKRAPAAPAPAAPPPPTPTINPARAAQLRAQGLEQLNRGAIGPAVTLLGEASRLDPANPLIRRDLERALRIRQAVKAKR